MSRKDDDEKIDLFQATKSRWKRMRTIVNPAFSSTKLRELSPSLVTCAERLVTVLDNNCDTDINLKYYLKRFTMDSLWNGAFGVDIDIQNDLDNEYFHKCEANFKMLGDLILPQYLGVYFHEIKEYILYALVFLTDIVSKFVDEKNILPIYWLRKKIGGLVRARLEQNVKKKKDFIQLLLDASAEFENEENFHYSDKKVLTQEEVEANLILFMLAGYDTTSTTLGFASYVLATYPQEQEKLYDEISSTFGSGTNVNTDNVQDLKYLDMFIKEVLRIYPVGNT